MFSINTLKRGEEENSMEEIQAKALEDNLKSLLGQLAFEHAVFERMVYKNKNQHRRCSYFKYLLKVRRDLRLLRIANMEEILRSCFHVIYGTRSKQKIHVLENFKFKKSDTGKPNILERLLGALHLLSQMTEPILKAASGISILLAQNFFRDFSLTFLALLARLRVLVQQVLLDAVSVYNSVTSTSMKKQSVKIAQDGVEVFREFYPKDEECITFWNVSGRLINMSWSRNCRTLRVINLKRKMFQKIMLLVGILWYNIEHLFLLSGKISLLCLSHTIVVLLQEDVRLPKLTILCNSRIQKTEKILQLWILWFSMKHLFLLLGEVDNDAVAAIESWTSIAETVSSKTEISEKLEDESTNPVSTAKVERSTIKPCCRANKVAFLPVKRSPSAISLNTIEEPPRKKQETSEKDKKAEDGFYNLLIRGTHKDGFF